MRAITTLALLSGLLISRVAFGAGVEVISASYGVNCNPNLRGNLTDVVKQSCKDKALCHFTVDHEKYGDPAVNCAKNFVVDYHCGGSSTTKSATIAAEATKQYVTLDCSQ